MILHFDIDEPKPLAQMSDVELAGYAKKAVAAHETMKTYVLSVYTEIINREHKRHAAQRPSFAVSVSRSTAPRTGPQLTDAQWKKRMMEVDEDE